MKKYTERSFVVGTHENGILSLTPCSARGCKTEEAPIEAVYAWMARQRLKANPSPHPAKPRRRRLLTHSDQMRTTVIRVRDMRDGDIYIGHRNLRYGLPETIWANPHYKDNCSQEEKVARFERHILSKPELFAQIPTLKGKRLACWCHPKPCHGDVLARLANDDHPQP